MLLNFFLIFVGHYRYPRLIEIAVREYPTVGVRSSKEAEVKSIKAMAKEWGKVVKKKAVAERSAAVTIFKKIWFDNESPFVLVTNVLETNLRKTEGDMEINPAIKATGVTTVEELRELIKTEDMYLNPALYSLICGGVESGKFKQNPRREPATISDLLTVAHEALIRSELHFALEKSKNRHVGSIDHGKLRKEEWKVFRDLVWNDRKKNEVNAHLARGNDVTGGSAGSDDDDDDDDGETMDPKYYSRTK